MNLLVALWAKLGNATWPDCYHPILYHLIDVAAITHSLWDSLFLPGFLQWLATRRRFDGAA